MRKFDKKEKGITLISLVITIIVLLILAGITIVTLSGENGLLNRAKSAKETSINSQIKENTTLSDYDTKINEYSSSTRENKLTTVSDVFTTPTYISNGNTDWKDIIIGHQPQILYISFHDAGNTIVSIYYNKDISETQYYVSSTDGFEGFMDLESNTNTYMIRLKINLDGFSVINKYSTLFKAETKYFVSY